MNRRSFLKWLGIGVPAAAAAVVVAPKLMEPKVVAARIGEWNSYYSEGDPELMEAIENWHNYSEVYPNLQTTFTLKHDASLYYDREMVQELKMTSDEVIKKLSSRQKIPVNTRVDRKLFQYNVVS